MDDKRREIGRDLTRVSECVFPDVGVTSWRLFRQSSRGKPRLPGFLCPCLMSPGHPLFVISVPQTTIPPLSSLASATGCEGCPFHYHSSSGLSSHTCPLPTCQAPGYPEKKGRVLALGQKACRNACLADKHPSFTGLLGLSSPLKFLAFLQF